MNKSALSDFAIKARKTLINSAVTAAGFYGVTKDGCDRPLQKGPDFEVYKTLAGTENRIFGSDIRKRANLVSAVNEKGFDQVIEETAYTWFNRIIAIRFMEVNDYLPSRVRVLSSESGSATPDIVSQSDTVDLNLSQEEIEKIHTAKAENRYDDAFQLLFIKQCNELNDILPGLFEKTDDYMELLLNITYTSDGVVRMLIDTVPEDNFNVKTEGQVEIIGWMYQYYNTDPKLAVDKKVKSGKKVSKEELPAKTQLFTPDWIVKYMVENSLGRIWIEHLRAVDSSVDEKAKAEEFGWKYYLPEVEQEPDVAAQLVEVRKSYRDLTPQDISCIDPCMGSGHILVYMFDVLMDIYKSEGFSERDAVFEILENNIHGLDIDLRAYQLSYFALMMKARGYNRIFFRGRKNEEGIHVHVQPKVYAIEESNHINRDHLKYFGANLSAEEKADAMTQMLKLLDQLIDAKEYGSILTIEDCDWNLLRRFVEEYSYSGQMNMDAVGIADTQKKLISLINEGETLAKKYCVSSTNPPYMSSSDMSTKLSDFVKRNFPDSKSDFFACFIERIIQFTRKNCIYSMITQHAFMFLSSYVDLRKKLAHNIIVNMAHLGPHAFDEIGGEVVQTTAFANCKVDIEEYKGQYVRLVEVNGEKEKEKLFLSHKNVYLAKQTEYSTIPENPIVYWISQNLLKTFLNSKLGDYANTCNGFTTGNNNLFLRLWHEVNINNIDFWQSSIKSAASSKLKWFPYNKGGGFRKWYGNNDYIINWENDGKAIKEYGHLVPRSLKYMFHESVTWNKITSGCNAFRYKPNGTMFDVAGLSMFANKREDIFYLLALCNTVYARKILTILSPTLNCETGHVSSIPVIIDNKYEQIIGITNECINISKEDWDSFETSWDFKRNPICPSAIEIKNYMHSQLSEESLKTFGRISCHYENWKTECGNRFNRLKDNEEKLNDIFIKIYGLEGELTPEEDDKDVTVRKADLGRDIRDFISYAVGCMFGRYSLDVDGLAYAGGEWNPDNYKTFPADEDGIIPICDEDYFNDDITGRFIEFVRAVYGEERLDENLHFIADALGGQGSPKEIIRNYFQDTKKGFYADHLKTYQKRPIYWMFDAGKNNGFKCLIYMHRYNEDTVGKIRSDYLVKAQDVISNSLKNAEYTINTSSSAVDRALATKKRDKYVKQLNEIKVYYQALSHVALKKIKIDLDDGVKVNYAKFQGIEISDEDGKKQTIDLLAKI